MNPAATPALASRRRSAADPGRGGHRILQGSHIRADWPREVAFLDGLLALGLDINAGSRMCGC
ncbi:hypothetical protein BRI6_2333 [plant metagenome]|uniref:Uncharacterized protein n=1 Tax=plant metagenome TaxID=1297885 RepID=A0A484TXJ3_9ZZZZ